MKLAIMQPYFFPYLGYISLIKHTDKFILFDNVQFIRHGWIERNRILKQNGGWQYIQIPLRKHSRETLIKDILINNEHNYGAKILAQLAHYKRKAPYYNKTIELLSTIFYNTYSDIVSLDFNILLKVCEFLDINADIEVFSAMELEIEKVNAPDEWALNICKAIGNVSEYWNPPGGITFFNRTKYQKENIEIKFHSIKLTEYDQKQSGFEDGLSIIDVMMYNSVDAINEMLDNYEFI